MNQNLNEMSDTITSISTGLTSAGIGIIRISGSKSKEIISKIFKTKNQKNIDLTKSNQFYYGYIYCTNNNDSLIPIDEVIVLSFNAPHSFTKEDVIEIQSHGGLLILKKILNEVIKSGARLATPGEFTKRAFLNGRIDLAKAESVADIIMSKNDYALQSSFKQLNGALSNQIDVLRKQILEINAHIESYLDDPEHIEINTLEKNLPEKINHIINDLLKLSLSYQNGKLIKEGIKTVILGKPNAGKSSLLNLMTKKERAIVTNIEGTTRDTLEESINIFGLTLNIIDTAGIRNKNIDEVEKIGIEKALNEATNADLILYVIDSSKELDANDNQIMNFIIQNKKKAIIILNKTDLNQIITKENLFTNFNVLNLDDIKSKQNLLSIINISCEENKGIENLLNTIYDLFLNKNIDYNNELFITNERHKNLIDKSINSLDLVLKSQNDNMPLDFLTIDLQDAYLYLSEVLGEEVNEDLINEIFSKFCMGK
ncbi:MAG: tRNA uridine-5-carboxymethylaminomethyl(34) synthesis GTPase MnmE [Eubacteriales bacterium]|nr:tRNA uridine-5-carboxymethylaminomethyl(34) synthesis GTPase MnmE [Eubacteriales bacterium]